MNNRGRTIFRFLTNGRKRNKQFLIQRMLRLSYARNRFDFEERQMIWN